MTSPEHHTTKDQLLVFRPGENARKLARVQFGLHRDGECGATLTYPIPGFPWRNNPEENVRGKLDKMTASKLFEEVAALPSVAPGECLRIEDCWADSSEKANSITRDRATNMPCLQLLISVGWNKYQCNYAMRENSPALLKSKIYRVVTELIAPYEGLYPNGRVKQ